VRAAIASPFRRSITYGESRSHRQYHPHVLRGSPRAGERADVSLLLVPEIPAMPRLTWARNDARAHSSSTILASYVLAHLHDDVRGDKSGATGYLVGE